MKTHNEDKNPAGSQPSKRYGSPQLHKSFTNAPPHLPISSINGFNYNLAKYLCKLLQPKIPLMHSTQNYLLSSKNWKR